MPDGPPKVPHRPNYNKPPEQGRHHYGTIHQKLRAQVLAANPVCVICKAAWATDAHHVRYPARSVNDYLAVCETCHHVKIHGRGVDKGCETPQSSPPATE